MKIKKGKQIKKVIINKDIVTALDSDNNEIGLTRSQRKTLIRYKQKEYIQDIQKEWQNSHVIHTDFTVIKNGEVVYTYTK
jgi:hypothetical protein